MTAAEVNGSEIVPLYQKLFPVEAKDFITHYRELKEAALIGLQFELDRIAAMINRVSAEIGMPVRRCGRPPGNANQESPRVARRTAKQTWTLSAEGRARIAAAARRKLAEYRARKTEEE